MNLKCILFGHVPPEGFLPTFRARKLANPAVKPEYYALLECQRCGEEAKFSEDDFTEDQE